MSLLLKQKRIWVQGLLTRCPVGKPIDCCPARHMREIPIAERLELAGKMSEAELNNILLMHQDCITHQLNELPIHF